MSLRTVACPQCRVNLRLSRPVPARKQLQCPQCGGYFLAASPPPRRPEPAPQPESPVPDEAAPSSPRSQGALLALALIAALVLMSTALIGVVILTRDNPKPETAANDPENRANVVDEDRKKLDEERKRFEEERKQFDGDKQRAEFERFMRQGAAALANQKYEEAAQAYADAVKLFPADVDAARGLGIARSAVSAVVKETKEKQTEGERQEAYRRLMSQGKEAMGGKQYAAAVAAFEAAGQLLPADPAATAALRDAQQAVAGEQEQKKKLADYQKHLEQGQAAMAAGRYADAIQEYAAAGRLLPGDEAAEQGRRAAEKRLEDLQDKEKRRSEYVRLMDQGTQAMRGQRWEEAAQAFGDAARLFPGDRAATQGLRDAQSALNQAKRDYGRLMDQGDLAMRAQRYEEAVRSYGEAVRAMPGDDRAVKALRQAERVLKDVEAAQAAYIRFMNQGDLAMRNGRFSEAVFAYSEALRVVPNDGEAARRLRDAQLAREDEGRRRVDFDKLMQAGFTAMRQGKYDDATKAFHDAQRLFPDDLRPANAMRQVRYNQFMADGQGAMKARKYADAVRAFENALRELPGDQAAVNALKQAKALSMYGK